MIANRCQMFSFVLVLFLNYGWGQAGIVARDPKQTKRTVDMRSVIRPSLIIDLGGTWQTTITGDDSVVKESHGTQFIPPGPGAKWTPVEVPGKHYDGSVCWFRRTVDIPAEWAGKRVRLGFRRTSFVANVFWNGKRVYIQVDPCYGYEVDISRAVVPGQKNELLVGVSGGTDKDVPASGYLDRMLRGIAHPVSLTVSDPVAVTDIFAKPSVSRKTLTLEVTVDSLDLPGAKARRVVPVAVVEDDGKIVKRLAGEAVDLLPGKSRVVTLNIPWPDAELWWPHRPYLYRAGVTLEENGKSLGGKSVRFGFRELEVKKHLIYLNGKKVFLRRTSALYMDGPESRSEMIGYRSHGYNAIRQHHSSNDSVFDVADEEGMLMFPEMHINLPWLVDDVHSRAWQFCRQQVEGIVRESRNHPSVLIWNICNEVTYYAKDKYNLAVNRLAELGDLARKIDPTRTVHFDGDKDLEGKAPTASLHYPWQIFKPSEILPTTIYWLDEKRVPWMGWVWKKDKPLSIGEDFFAPYSARYPQGVSNFAGDRAYVDPDGWIEAGLLGLKWLQEGYAHAEVFAYNPWGHALDEMYPRGAVMRPIILALREKNTTFSSGEKVRRTLYVYNHTFEDKEFILKVRLGDEGKEIYTKDFPLSLIGGNWTELKIDIPLPQVSSKQEYHFTVQLVEKQKEATDGEQAIWSVFPKLSPADWPKVKIVVVSGPKNLQELHTVGLPFQARKTVGQALSLQPDLILVYGGSVSPAEGAELNRYVSHGGRVILTNVPNGSWLPGGALIADGGNHFSTHAFFAVNKHPLLDGMNAPDIQLWRPDTYACRGTFSMPVGNSLKTILNAGGMYGIQWAPLLELQLGKGRFVLNQMNVVNRISIEPAAGYLLKNMVRAALRPVENTSGPLWVVSPEKSPLHSFIKTNRFLLGDRAGSNVTLVDGSPSAKKVVNEKLAAPTKRKETILLHNLTPNSAATISKTLGIPIVLTVKNTGQIVRAGRDPIIDGLSNDDFFWMVGQFGVDQGFSPQLAATTPICEYVLDIKGSPGWRALTAPAALAVYEKDNLRVVLDQIRWDVGKEQEKTRCLRIGTALLSNLGAKIEDGESSRLRTLAFIDLKSVVNRGFIDPVEGDGQGGWTDEGPKWDMRFFPVNRVGTDRNGLGCPKEQFPERSSMGGCEFKLINPETNNGKSCLVIGTGKGLSKEAMSIPVGQAARAIWFLHTSAIGWDNATPVEVAKITVHYADGTTSLLPVQNRVHLTDWRDGSPATLAEVAWRGYCIRHEPAVVHAYRWENPHPEKQIRSLSVTGTTGVYILIGLTLEKE
jgi:hypothetical protein